MLDDKDGRSLFKAKEAKKGNWGACLKDAYNGDYVHNCGMFNKAVSKAVFKFNPPQDGCYLVEEYHPGGDKVHGKSCSQYLHQAVPLKIGSCKDKKAKLSIDQSRNGGQWNVVGQWPFFKGKKSAFVLSSPAEDSCASSKCMWVADAFRATWTGAKCNKTGSLLPESSSLAQDDEDEDFEDIDGTEVRGTVSLIVTSRDDNTDLQLKIKNAGVLEAGLKAQFGYTSVKLISVDIASQRRLAAAIGTNSRIDATFEAKGTTKDTSEVVMSLTERFQILFDARDSGIQVKSVEVSWDASSTGEEVDTVGSPVLVLVLVFVGSALVMLSLGLMVRMRMITKKTSRKKLPDITTTAVEALEDPEKATESKEMQSKEDTVSVSTAPPPSDADVCSEGSVPQEGAKGI